ncbi:hypothetical protein A2U01_0076959, partial [Trifolium medium]|nr:hypothetical protein [Trifolium medium]
GQHYRTRHFFRSRNMEKFFITDVGGQLPKTIFLVLRPWSRCLQPNLSSNDIGYFLHLLLYMGAPV